MKESNTGFFFSFCFSRDTASQSVTPVKDSFTSITQNSGSFATPRHCCATIISLENKTPLGYFSKVKTQKILLGEIQTDIIHSPIKMDSDLFAYPQSPLRLNRLNGMVHDITMKKRAIKHFNKPRCMGGNHGANSPCRKIVSGVETNPICDISNQSTSFQGSVR